MVEIGITFLSPTPPYSTEHMFIVIAVDNNINEALFVNVTTKKPSSDTSCLLKVGDHPFIKHESVINYADTQKTSIDNLEKAFTAGILKTQQSVSQPLLERILRGAKKSDALPEKYKKYLS